MVALGEADLNTQAGHYMSKQRTGRPVQLGNRHDVFAGRAEIQNREMQGSLAGTYAERFESALERGDPPLENVIGRVSDSGVSISFNLEIEEGSAMLGTV